MQEDYIRIIHATEDCLYEYLSCPLIVQLFFLGLYSQKIKTLKNFEIKNKENEISHVLESFKYSEDSLYEYLFCRLIVQLFLRDFIHKKWKH